MDKILIEFLGGVVNLEDTINIRNDDEHVYVDTAHGSIILYKSISYEEDETKAKEENIKKNIIKKGVNNGQ